MEAYLNFFDEWFHKISSKLDKVPFSVISYYESPEFKDDANAIVAIIVDIYGGSKEIASRLISEYNNYLHSYLFTIVNKLRGDYDNYQKLVVSESTIDMVVDGTFGYYANKYLTRATTDYELFEFAEFLRRKNGLWKNF